MKNDDLQLDTALAFWKDAVRQFMEASRNPKTQPDELARLLAYQVRARKGLAKAFKI